MCEERLSKIKVQKIFGDMNIYSENITKNLKSK